MFCPNCGAPLNDNAVFCSTCGNRLVAFTDPMPLANDAPAIKRTNLAMGIIAAIFASFIAISNLTKVIHGIGELLPRYALEYILDFLIYAAIIVFIFVKRGKFVMFPLGILVLSDILPWFRSIAGSFENLANGNTGYLLYFLNQTLVFVPMVLVFLMSIYLLNGKAVIPSRGFLKFLPFILRLISLVITLRGISLDILPTVLRTLGPAFAILFMLLFIPLWIRKPERQ